jgi:light-regulated signal transduction histidine kinase (bacteriophytochrome)
MGVVAQIVDISERRAAVAEIRHLNATLEDRVAQRTAELTAANQALEEFSYSVAHDLRAPLRAIHGHASVIAEEDIGKLGDAGRAHLARIQVATKRMAQLIDGVLQLSRVTRTSLHREDTDLTLFAREIAGQLAKGSARNVEFRIGESIKAHADPTLIRVVMDNLLGNAWKFTRDRAPARIEFGLTTMDGERVFFVRDNGIGFDPAYADKLFQPFQRLHDENEYEGSGIGLAIVQRIIQHHRGRIWAEGAVDRGATFYFTLPQ